MLSRAHFPIFPMRCLDLSLQCRHCVRFVLQLCSEPYQLLIPPLSGAPCPTFACLRFPLEHPNGPLLAPHPRGAAYCFLCCFVYLCSLRSVLLKIYPKLHRFLILIKFPLLKWRLVRPYPVRICNRWLNGMDIGIADFQKKQVHLVNVLWLSIKQRIRWMLKLP